MRQLIRVVLTGASVWALMALLPFAILPAHAQAENVLNSSTVQVVHNTPGNTDVLNLSLNVTNNGDIGSCDGESDDLLETGVHISLWGGSCSEYFLICSTPGPCPTFDFDAQVNYVEHEVGSASYGTSFAANKAGNVSSKIVPSSTTPPSTCGTWTINLQGTGQNLSGITSTPVALFINESDVFIDFATNCFTVDAHIGNGITKPHHGVHATRHR